MMLTTTVLLIDHLLNVIVRLIYYCVCMYFPVFTTGWRPIFQSEGNNVLLFQFASNYVCSTTYRDYEKKKKIRKTQNHIIKIEKNHEKNCTAERRGP